ncbi:voltage-dependent anion channel-domain-containing protein [Leptodontidium sp. MPI-SDFR-AT-0119]|nr:voltage-dependent anion channel-domain-containing protein [Leptodontidium sp. MPI-SDFR-AT-0119]
MPASTPIPGRLNPEAPENGYESPGLLEEAPVFFSDLDMVNSGEERRRTGYNGRDDVADTERSNSRTGTSPQTSNRADEEKAAKDIEAGTGGVGKVGFRDRIACYTWTWFTMNMATGGIANVINGIPYKSEWLRIIGVILFLSNIVLFLINCVFISIKFKIRPGSFTASFTSSSESLFIPASVVSLGTILINMCQYGIPYTGPWFQTVMQVCFWAYVSLSVIASSGIYLIIWSTQSFPIHMMTPIWIFPAYPLLLVAPFAANLIAALPDAAAAIRINSIAIAFGAVCLQGTGFLVSLMIYSAFIYRLMTQKLPRETTRPGMFVSVGPSGFTVAGLVLLGNTGIWKISPNEHFGNENAEFILRLISLLVGIWLWGLCLWFFLVSVGAHWQIIKPDDKHQIHFDMTWFSFVFPNTALVTATFTVANSLDSRALRIFGTVLAVLLIMMWIYVFGMMIRALALRRILWPEQVDGAERIRRRWARQIEEAKKQHSGESQ